MSIFWIGLICIIIFLLYQYRNLEMKYNNLSNNGSLKSIDKKRLIKKIEKIENELVNIKKQLSDEVGDA
tara:strand:- start:317 stop:523 length:207 start_codon:yes stop_codon:yes gene_type:complete